LNKKRKHHYVWEHYLGAWATKGQVWCRRDGRVFKSSTENVGQQRDFYRLKEMSDQDVEVVFKIIDRMADFAQETARGWVRRFRVLHQLLAAWRASGAQHPSFEAEIDVAINDMEEDLHDGIEGKALPILTALRQGDAALLADDDVFIDFARYVAAQYFRTAVRRTALLEALAGFGGSFNVDATWGVLRTIFADNLGGFIFVNRRRMHLTFLEGSASDFVTGDQPIVNADGRAGAHDVEHFRLYYPADIGLA
jgi:hypothetical protein